MRLASTVLIIMTVSLGGCGIVWDSNGQRHALGIGYVAWPQPGDQGTTVVQGVDVAGAAVMATRGNISVVVGYDRERSVQLGDDQYVALDCLDCDLAKARPRAGHVQ